MGFFGSLALAKKFGLGVVSALDFSTLAASISSALGRARHLYGRHGTADESRSLGRLLTREMVIEQQDVA